jgi:hypothetical protein
MWPKGHVGLREFPTGTDVWDLHAAGLWVVIPTNVTCKGDGTAVMGAGLALDAATRFPDLPARYGRALRAGNPRVAIGDHRLLLAPTKDHWREPAQMALVLELLDGAVRWTTANPELGLAVVAPGCGLGGLGWPLVRAAAVDRLARRRVALLAPGTSTRRRR